MDILRNLFGSLTSGIIRLLVTVGILGAAYLRIVKPALETTKEISREANSSFERAFGDKGPNGIGGQIEDVSRQVQRQVRRSLKMAQRQGHSSKLIRCIRRANQDVTKIESCTLRY